MKKVIIGIVILLVIIAGGLYVLFANLDAIVKAAIEQYGSEVTQTAVRVKRVRIDLQNGAGGIYGITIANPEGFESRQAFSLGETSVKLNLQSLGKDVIVIDRITVREPAISYEMNARREGSLNKLYDNISKSLPAGSGRQQEKASDDGPKLIIRRLVFEGGAIDARMVPLDNKKYSVKLPAIRMNDLGAPRGATGAQLAKEILGRITREAQDEVKRQVVDKRLKSAIDAERKKLEGAAQKRIDEEKKKVDQRIQDMLKR